MTSDDEGRGLVPAALAHHLHLPILAGAQDLTPEENGFAVTLLGGGQRLQLSCQGPLVVTVAPSWDGPPIRHEAPPLCWEELSLADLGLDEHRLLGRPDMLGELQPPPDKPEVVSLDGLVKRWLRA
jgi:electron transfer flavoprotein alpha/beta subunit